MEAGTALRPNAYCGNAAGFILMRGLSVATTLKSWRCVAPYGETIRNC